jgi:CMP-N,N'-diacetyllegionaminic acid synthase
VLQHALAHEEAAGRRYDTLLLLDPTSPTRLPGDVSEASRRLAAAPNADGVVAVSEPDFSPIWHSVVDRGGWMSDLLPEGAAFDARQQAPRVLHITGLLYLWRADFVRRSPNWRKTGRHLMLELPERRACSIDTLDQFERVEALVKAGLIELPWLRMGASA